MEPDLSEAKIAQALIFFHSLAEVAKIGFMSGLASCGCDTCTEILGRIKYGDLR